jgi:hypothetical protein
MDNSSQLPRPEYVATIITPEQVTSAMNSVTFPPMTHTALQLINNSPSFWSTHMHASTLKVISPMSDMALQLLINPPKMSTKCAVFTNMVAQLTR